MVQVCSGLVLPLQLAVHDLRVRVGVLRARRRPRPFQRGCHRSAQKGVKKASYLYQALTVLGLYEEKESFLVSRLMHIAPALMVK